MGYSLEQHCLSCICVLAYFSGMDQSHTALFSPRQWRGRAPNESIQENKSVHGHLCTILSFETNYSKACGCPWSIVHFSSGRTCHSCEYWGWMCDAILYSCSCPCRLEWEKLPKLFKKLLAVTVCWTRCTPQQIRCWSGCIFNQLWRSCTLSADVNLVCLGVLVLV